MEPEAPLDLVGRIYDTELDAALWHSVLGDIRAFADTVSAANYWHDTFDPSVVIFHEWGEKPEYKDSYIETYAGCH